MKHEHSWTKKERSFSSPDTSGFSMKTSSTPHNDVPLALSRPEHGSWHPFVTSLEPLLLQNRIPVLAHIPVGGTCWHITGQAEGYEGEESAVH